MNKGLLKAAAVIGYISAVLAIIAVVILDIYVIILYNQDFSGFTLEEKEILIFTMTFLAIFLTIFTIPIVIATFIGSKKFLGYSELDDDELSLKQNSIIGWSVFFVLTNFIAGVLGFIAAFSGSKTKTFSLENRLKELQNLYDKGIISKEEYQDRRAAIIAKTP